MSAPPTATPASLRNDLRRIALLGLCGFVLLLPIVLLLQRPPKHPQVTLIGGGDSLSVLLEGAGGGRVLVGGGAAQSDVPAALGRQLWPWDRRIDLLLVADTRDLPGATELVRRGAVRAVATVGLTEQRTAAAGLATLRDVCAARKVALRAIEEAERIAIGRDPQLALTVTPPETPDLTPRLRLQAGALDAPIVVGAATGEGPALGAILLRATQESYWIAAGTEARLIAAPAPPGGVTVPALAGRYLLLLGAGERATLIVDERGLRLRGATFVSLDAPAPPR